jgi:hypothetical protein
MLDEILLRAVTLAARPSAALEPAGADRPAL